MKSVASRLRLLPLALLLALGSCSTTTSVQRVPMPDQSVEIADASMSRVYVLQPQTDGEAASVAVFDGQAEIGQVGTGRYLCWERPAGRTLMRVVYKPIEARAAQEGLLDLNTEPGRVYVCSVEILEGEFEPTLVLLALEEGRSLLPDLAAAEVNLP